MTAVVLKTRESASRPYAGIVTAGTRGLNQDGFVCLTYTRSVMVYKRSAEQDKGHFPAAQSPITQAFSPGSSA
jgi:itaconyl-CoA hydratase